MEGKAILDKIVEPPKEKGNLEITIQNLEMIKRGNQSIIF
jgi:hypothetical protein